MPEEEGLHLGDLGIKSQSLEQVLQNLTAIYELEITA
jgi:hypothetical protein